MENRFILFTERFKRMELENKLFHEKTRSGTRYWDIIRMHVYLNMLNQMNAINYFPLPMNTDFTIKKLIKYIVFTCYGIATNLKISCQAKGKAVFFLLSRSLDSSGIPKDFLLDDYVKEENENALLIEYFRHPLFREIPRARKGRFFLYGLEAKKLLFRNVNKNDWSKLKQILKTELNYGYNDEIYWDQLLNRYDLENKFYLKLFRKLQPKRVYFQSEPKSMVAAANMLGIETLDVLHGHINETGIFYNYPSLPKLNTTPTHVLTFGDYWNKYITMNTNVQTVGSNYFYPELDSTDSEVIYDLLIITRREFNDELFPFTKELARTQCHLMIVYKLHSNQGDEYEKIIQDFKNQSNVKVVYTENTAEQLLKVSKALFMIQSTVGYQALQMNKKVFILKKYIYEFSYDLFDKNGVYLVDNLSDVVESLEKKEIFVNNVFFEPFEQKNLNYLQI